MGVGGSVGARGPDDEHRLLDFVELLEVRLDSRLPNYLRTL